MLRQEEAELQVRWRLFSVKPQQSSLGAVPVSSSPLVPSLSASARRTAETRPARWRSRSRARAGGSASSSSRSSRRPAAPWYVGQRWGIRGSGGHLRGSPWDTLPRQRGHRSFQNPLCWVGALQLSPCVPERPADPTHLLALQDLGRPGGDSGFRAAEGELCRGLGPALRPHLVDTWVILLRSQDACPWTRRTVTAAWSPGRSGFHP